MTTLAHDNRSIQSTIDDAQFGASDAVRRFLHAWQQRRISAAERRRAAQADHQLWNAALADPRIMAEITRAQPDHPGEIRKQRMMRLF